MLIKLSLIQLYNCKSHIGYSRDSYFKLIKDFIFATKVDYFILYVIKTLVNLKLAIWFSFYISVYSNKMLFIYNTPESFIYTFGLLFKIFGHFTLKTKWRIGTLTNFRRIRKHYRYLYVKYIKDFKIYKKLTFFTYYNKKLAPQICDFLFIRRLPSLIIVLSAYISDMALRESFIVRIPSIGLNSNRSLPLGLTFPIISNDVSEETFNYYLFLFKNIMYKSLYYRRSEFFDLLRNNLNLNCSILKIWKLKLNLTFKIHLQNIFPVINMSKYKLIMLKYNKHFKRKVSYFVFLKYKRKRYYKFEKFYSFFRKEKKRGNFFLRSIFFNYKLNFYYNKKVNIKSFTLTRKNFFTNMFFFMLSKKKFKISKKKLKKSKEKTNIKIKKIKGKKILNSIFFFKFLIKINEEKFTIKKSK